MPDITATMNIPGLGKPGNLTPLEAARYNEYQELVHDMNERGWEQASVINLHPFSLYPNGPVHKEKKIPGIPLDEIEWGAHPSVELASGSIIPYTHHIIANWEPMVLETVTGIEGSFSASIKSKASLPFDLAGDILHQNNSPTARGGVVIYKGSHRPFENPKTLKHEQEMFEEAHTRQLGYYDALYSAADRAHMKQNDAEWREITMYHRWATRYLVRIGRLADMPKWYTEILKPGGGKTSQVCVCGARPSLQAVICKDCNRVLDPFAAFDQYVIDLETPGAKLVLRRLTPAQLKELVKLGRFTEADLETVGFVPEKKGKKEEKAN